MTQTQETKGYNSATIEIFRSHQMKKIAALTALALTVASASAFAETFKGVVSDAMCSSDTAKASKADHEACATKCIKGGDKAVLIVGDKVYNIANQPKVTSFAGKTVTIDGTLDKDTITVASIK
jgi:hypothetical protein